MKIGNSGKNQILKGLIIEDRNFTFYFLLVLYTVTHRIEQGNEQTRTFEPTNERVDCWPAKHSYNFIIKVKKRQQINSILIGWEESCRLYLSFNKVSWILKYQRAIGIHKDMKFIELSHRNTKANLPVQAPVNPIPVKLL